MDVHMDIYPSTSLHRLQRKGVMYITKRKHYDKCIAVSILNKAPYYIRTMRTHGIMV
jgi:hypothetical protein